MDRLPDEVFQVILSYLAPEDIISLQTVSRSLLRLGRDNGLWKIICYDRSAIEASRQRARLMQDSASELTELREAVVDALGAHTERQTSQPRFKVQQDRKQERARALATWDPSRPGERIDFYQEYIHRHAPITVDWLQDADDSSTRPLPGAIGMATLIDSLGRTQKVVAPLEDGSISIWDMAQDSDAGFISARSQHGLLSAPEACRRFDDGQSLKMNEPSAVDNVSIDSQQKRAYFAVHNYLNEVDLETLQIIRRERFEFPLSCLSEAKNSIPLTIGTSESLHLYDTRDKCSVAKSNFATIASRTSHSAHPSPDLDATAVLSHSAPLSIVHSSSQPSSPHSIWVGGRFTSLLSYDRRVWPSVNTTIYSGGRISSLIFVPRSYVTRSLDLTRNPSATLSTLMSAKSIPGSTLVAAGHYKGKGSLELYGLSAAGTPSNAGEQSCFQNRQTASRSRLLSVATHGARLVFSDGDGILKWVEPDDTSFVRRLDINEHLPRSKPEARPRTPDSGYGSGASSPEVWQQFAAELTGESSLFAESENSTGDIVQKIIPTHGNGCEDHSRSPNSDDLLIWTGDGRIGNVGFRGRNAFDSSYPESNAIANVENDPNEEAMRLFEARMRRALERQADEVRFVRGLGL